MIATTPEPTTRALATIETITGLRDIPEADLIVCARIRGWDVVVKRGEFTVGDSCLYIEVDAMLDTTDPRFEFLAPRGIRTDMDGRSGHVLKTARLRGQYSQGLALPLAGFPELSAYLIGDDATATLNIVKWDPPISADLAATARGYRPAWIPVTDEDRIQNVATILGCVDSTWEATEKVDGTSTTFYVEPDTNWNGVCRRNLDLQYNPDQTMWALAAQHNIHALLTQTYAGQRAVVQGETYGPGIQKNPLRVREVAFAAFTLRVNGAIIPRGMWPQWLLDLSVPVRPLTAPTTVEETLAQVEAIKSLISTDRAAEGVVWRSTTTGTVTLPDGQIVDASFKAISNRYLLKNDR